MGLQLTKKEAEEQGRCAGCISYYPDDPIIPPFATHCRASVNVDRYIWCPKSDDVPKIEIPRSKPKRRKVDPANKQVTFKEYLKSGGRSC